MNYNRKTFKRAADFIEDGLRTIDTLSDEVKNMKKIVATKRYLYTALANLHYLATLAPDDKDG